MTSVETRVPSLGPTQWKEEMWLPQAVLWPQYLCQHTYMHSCVYVHKINKIINIYTHMHMSNRTDNITSLSNIWYSYWKNHSRPADNYIETSLSESWSWRTRQREWLYKPSMHWLCAVCATRRKQLFVLDITHVCTMKPLHAHIKVWFNTTGRGTW